MPKSHLSRLAAGMQSDVKLLWVDDNPMALARLRDRLRPLAKVATRAHVLPKAVDEAPHLPASCFGMDGSPFADKLESREPIGCFSRIPLATIAGVPEKLVAKYHLADRLRLVDQARRDAGGESEEEEDVLLDS